MVPSTRSTQKKSKLVSNGGVKKGKNRTIDEINIIIEKHSKQLKALENCVNKNVAVVWNLDVKSESSDYFDLKNTRLESIYKFLNDVIGEVNYSKTEVISCEWLNEKKNMMEVGVLHKDIVFYLLICYILRFI
jgi:hypothetical protein